MNHKAMKCSTHAELNVPSPHMTLCPIISIILTYVENKKYAKYDNNQYKNFHMELYFYQV